MNKIKIYTLVLVLTIVSTTALRADERQNPSSKLKVNKTMMKNFLKSLLIPGWGQLSNGNNIRAAVYLTAEIAAYYGYHTNYSNAEDGEQEFKEFADEHWYYGRWSPTNDGETACGNNLRTHLMPILKDPDGIPLLDENGFNLPYKDHHFYENISKYPEFICGWDDIAEMWEVDEKSYTPNKQTYIKMRTLSNDQYRNAQVAGTLIMLNHLVSAFDAALGTDISSFETTSVAGKFYINPLNTVNSVGLEVKF